MLLLMTQPLTRGQISSRLKLSPNLVRRIVERLEEGGHILGSNLSHDRRRRVYKPRPAACQILNYTARQINQSALSHEKRT